MTQQELAVAREENFKTQAMLDQCQKDAKFYKDTCQKQLIEISTGERRCAALYNLKRKLKLMLQERDEELSETTRQLNAIIAEKDATVQDLVTKNKQYSADLIKTNNALYQLQAEYKILQAQMSKRQNDTPLTVCNFIYVIFAS